MDAGLGLIMTFWIIHFLVSDGNIVYKNEGGGYLLRTKSATSQEGGVASGFAVLDSPFLV